MNIESIKGKAAIYRKKALIWADAFMIRAKSWFSGISRREYTVRDGIVLLVVAIILGAGLKVVAADTFTIGYEDYRLKPVGATIDIDAIQKEMIEKGESMPVADDSSRASCSQRER